MLTPLPSRRPRARASLRPLLLGATVLTASAGLASAALAQTTTVSGTLTVGSPVGTAPGPVTTPLSGIYTMGATGRVILNHGMNTGVGYALDPAVSLRGSVGSVIELAAGTTTFTHNAPTTRPSTTTGIGGVEAVNAQPGNSQFAGAVQVRNGATLNLAQQFTLNTRFQGVAPNRVSVVEESGAFSTSMFGGDLIVEAGGV